MQKEVRSVSLVIEESSESRKVSGYASVFDSETNIGGMWVEKIARGAFSRTLEENKKIRLLWNHDDSTPLGRSDVNLSLVEDEKGLKIDAELPDTAVGNDVNQLIRSGIIDGMSFGFFVKEGGDQWSRDGDVVKRVISDIELIEVSIVTFPAYDDTSIEARDAYNNFVNAEKVDIIESNNTRTMPNRRNRLLKTLLLTKQV